MGPKNNRDRAGFGLRGACFSPLVWLCVATAWPVAASAAAGGKSVLTVFADERLLPANGIVDEAIRARLGLGPTSTLTYYSEFLDVVRFPGDEQDRGLAEFLRQKYSGKTIDVIISPGPLALDFLLRHRAELFPNVPIVHCVLSREEVARLKPPPDVVGVPEDFDSRPTIELALRLHPRSRELVVVTGTSKFDRVWEERLRRLLPAFENRVRVRHLAGLPLDDLLRELSMLAPDRVVFTPTFLRDGAGRTFIARNSLVLMERVSTAPIYGVYSTGIGFGLVGVRAATFEAIGAQAAEIALRILSGENPGTMKLPPAVPSDLVFDWRRLRRWGIRETDLPAGSILRFRSPTFWEANRWFVAGGVALCILEAILITALLIHRARRRTAEEGLRESEHRMSLAASAAELGLWVWDVVRDEIWMTEDSRALFGFGKSERIGFDRFLSVLHTEDREGVRRSVEQSLAEGGEFEREYRVVRPDTQTLWIAARGRVERSGGSPVRMRGVSLDITRRKLAELEVERQRNELAHLSRVTMLGELSGSLAHELNQPLTSILSNAQAAQRFLAHGNDLDEVRDILKDIVEEDKHAGEVIRRLRLLLKKGEVHHETLDVAEVVRDVLRIARSDLVNQGVAVTTELASHLPAVSCDRVQLQQVLLNLVMNGCDAMAETAPSDRELVVRAEAADGDGVRVSVSDNGSGIADDQTDRIFDPFFTTKAHGMGLGLAVCRTIITAHGGRLWAANNNGRGATLHFTVPAAGRSAGQAAP